MYLKGKVQHLNLEKVDNYFFFSEQSRGWDGDMVAHELETWYNQDIMMMYPFIYLENLRQFIAKTWVIKQDKYEPGTGNVEIEVKAKILARNTQSQIAKTS